MKENKPIRTIAYSFGIIDYMHFGHIRALETAAKNCDLHVFGLVSDQAALSWTGALISSYDERKSVLEHVDCIDRILYQDSFDPLENLKMLHRQFPQAKIVLYHGNDWKIMPAVDYLHRIGGDAVFTQYYEKLSPDRILSALKAGTGSAKPQNPGNLISTKANTLRSLKPLLKKSRIEELLIVYYGEWCKHRDTVLEQIRNRFCQRNIVVRSSSTNEDCFEQSNAGHFESLLNIPSGQPEQVEKAIDAVFASYGMRPGEEGNESQQVLVQFQTTSVERSGVVFTRDIHQNRPYYVINYDQTGATDSVTSGAGGETVWLARNVQTQQVSPPWRSLIEAIREIEQTLPGMVLDVEFAIDSSCQVTIFQVRPLAAVYKFNRQFDDSHFYDLLEAGKTSYHKVIDSVRFDTVQLSDMAFWNPAEIIGSNPHNLDYSLYRQIITKHIWNDGIVPMGYQKVHKDLMCRIGNKPYIILEHAFRSLVPAALPETLKDKLVRHYIRMLKADLSAHDKIEFEIVLSCFDFQTEEKLNHLAESGDFTQEELRLFRSALFELTQQAIRRYPQVLEQDREDLTELEQGREHIAGKLAYQQNNPFALIQCFKDLISLINRCGTPMFSRQARFAFIAKALCRTMVEAGLYGKGEMDDLLSSVHTVASDFERDYKAFLAGKLSKGEFNRRYGHLRSGTYDICTPRYDQISFRTAAAPSAPPAAETDKVPHICWEKFRQACQVLAMGISPQELVAFIKTALEQREYFKFEFTKALSLAIEVLAMVAGALGISRKDMAHLELADILASEYYDSREELSLFWNTLIAQRKLRYRENSQLVLPEVITQAEDITQVHFCQSRPNFISAKSVQADAVVLTEATGQDITGKIVILEKADPGYDWIFTRGIAGLITKYGGVASHMAIRCAEFDMPAAIGCGEKIYSQVCQASRLQLDCKKGEIRPV